VWLAQFSFDSTTIGRIEERAPLITPLLAATAVNLATAVLMWGPFARALPQASPAAAQAVTMMSWLLVLFYPAIALGKAALFSAATWGVASVGGREASFRRLVSLFLYGELLLLLPGFFTGVVLTLRGPAASRAPEHLLVPWGIDMIVQVRSAVAIVAAQATTIFHLLWFVFLGVALARLVSWRRAQAWMTALVLWGGLVAFGVLRLAAQ
jgi:hypothetical protein